MSTLAPSTVKGKILFGAVGLVAIAALVVGAINGYRYWNDRQSEDARTEAVAAAGHAVTDMFTYTPENVDTVLQQSAQNLTESFRDDYLKLVNQAIAPGAKEKQLTVQATVQAGGVIAADDASATVMLFLNQVTTSKDSPQGNTTASRVRVVLDKQDSHWLVDSVTPI
ncbi:h domain protein [Nocardia callitridis]|uniref:H domain protein n=1 Tax=Nocardia callitridis TaxID=648753 RepID=A0ABP9JVB9_9NOCA